MNASTYKTNKFLLNILIAVAFSAILPATSFAQSVDVKNVDSQEEGTTTIEIKKSKATENQNSNSKAIWEITDGTSDIAGDTAAGQLDAKKSWQTSCDNWKKEFRADNKDNKIINISCGIPNCGGEAGKKSCTSTATYKIKTRLD